MKNRTFENEGRLWVRKALNENELKTLIETLDIDSKIGARFNMLDVPTKTKEVLRKVNTLADDILPNAKLVKLTAFNKISSKTNWALPWHQDRCIAVQEKISAKGFYNWSKKSGIWHCEPPLKFLEKMIFARVHLDKSDESNGCLELALGSHKYGKILSNNIGKIITDIEHEVCIAKRGDILFVKALTLHRSQLSQSTFPRKALRIDFTNQDLPSPLNWHLQH